MSDYPIRIVVRPLLTCGVEGSGPNSVFILLADDMSRAEATVTLWHEWVHIFKRVGGAAVQDEAEVDAIAKKLAAACPEILELCGIADKFKMVAASGIEPPRLTLSESGPSAIPG